MLRTSPVFIAILSFMLAPPVLSGQDIHQASIEGNPDRVSVLLEAQPELLESRDGADRTPLMCAAQEGHAEQD